MKKDQKILNSILLINSYLIKCKLENNKSSIVDTARKYLISKIDKAIVDRALSIKVSY